jgi:hypothetical protein
MKFSAKNPATTQRRKTLWASLNRHTATNNGRQENRLFLHTTHLDSHLRLTTIIYFQKNGDQRPFKKRGVTEKPYE